MNAWALVPLLASLALALGARRLGRVLPPRTAAWTLTTASLVTALSTGYVLSLAAFTLIARFPDVARIGRWSSGVLGAGDPVPPAVGPALAAVVLALLAAAAHHAQRDVRDMLLAHSICRRLGPGTAGLIVLDDPAPDAYALTGFPGRIVVSTAMLRALPAAERRALLAHEESHLRHRHHLFVALSGLAASANPALRQCARQVRLATERWADEDAAACTDRVTTAHALARAGLATAAARESDGRTPPRQVLVAGATDADLPGRVRALVGNPLPPRRVATTVLASLVLATAVSALWAGRVTETRFERAQDLYPRAQWTATASGHR